MGTASKTCHQVAPLTQAMCQLGECNEIYVEKAFSRKIALLTFLQSPSKYTAQRIGQILLLLNGTFKIVSCICSVIIW